MQWKQFWVQVSDLQFRRPYIGTAMALAAIVITFSFLSPAFFSTGNAINVFLQSAVLVVAAMGATLVLISGEIDLAVGSLIGFSGVVAAVLVVTHGFPVVIGIGAALLLAAGATAITGSFATRLGVPSFIASLGMMGIAHGLGLVLTDGRPVSSLPDSYRFLGRGIVAGLPVPVWIALFLLVTMHILLTHTRTGVHLLAVGGDSAAAGLSGVNTSRVKMLAFIVGGLSAGIAGIMLSARLGAGNANFGQGDLLNVYAAIILGGTAITGGRGSIIGTGLGVLIIAAIRNGLNLTGVTPFWQQVAIGTVILLAVVVDRLAMRTRA